MSETNENDDHVADGLPRGWMWTKFEDTCEPVSDGGRKVPQKSYLKQGEYPVVDQGEELIGGYTDNSDALFRGNLPVIAFGDHTRRFKLIQWPFAVGADGVKLIAPSGTWHPKCLWFFLRALKFEDRGYSRHFQFLRKAVLPLPPFAEQVRIADALDELLSDLDAGVAALEQARAKLVRYRASVLKAAVDGTLTAEWREQHRHAEPAAELLERILAERRRRWEEEQLRKFDEKGQKPPKNWKEKYKEPVAPDTANLPALPDGWCWATVQQCGEVQLGRQRAPQHHFGEHMRPYLRVANVFEDRIDTRDVKEMNFTPEEFITYALRYGDILLNEGQSPELVGRPAMYRDEIPGCCYQKTLLRFRAYPGVVASYALSVFRAYLHNGRFRKSANITTSIAHLAAERFVTIEFPLPPLDEQEAIVEAVEQHLSVITHLEAELDNKLKSAQALRQSILRHAFTGRLVPQDPEDEPASELLKRIAAEREERDGKKSTKSGAGRKARAAKNKGE